MQQNVVLCYRRILVSEGAHSQLRRIRLISFGMPRPISLPATLNPLTHLPKVAAQKRRVAGYARVSTDSDEQFTSYEAQGDHYTKFIQSKPEWDFVKVYMDEGIFGCNTKRRNGFNSMVSDALAGKIDLIVTKSVSRFARNTVDSLVTIRKLKENGVECYFEKEGIFTFDGKSQASICRCLEKLGIKRNWTPIKIRIVSKLASSYGRGRRTRTLNKGFGDPRVTITPCPYAVRPGLPERDLV